MLGNKLINTNAGGGCTNTVDLYNPFPDGGGLALYQLNGDATDVSGNYDGTASNVTYGAGEFGQAGVFNGSNSYISNTSISGFPSGAAARTLSFWVNAQGSGVRVIGGYGNTATAQYFGLSITLENAINFLGYNYNLTTTYTIPQNQWVNIVTTYDGTTQLLYANGVQVYSVARTYNTVSSEFRIGDDLWGTTERFEGSIDQVRIFNRALRPYEVEALYTEEYCTPTIVPSEHFNTVTYDGNGSANHAITGVGFAPDFTWIKNRDTTTFHALVNSVVGENYIQYSNSTSAGETNANIVTSLDSDGFTVGIETTSNGSGQNLVSWNFKAGGAAVTNTDGTITSQVSANTEAGFSIVSYYLGTTGVSQTIGHGLNSEPKFIITKQRDGTLFEWTCYHESIGINKYILLNSTAAAITNANVFPTLPTENVFTLGSGFNTTGTDMITYCFAEVEGFSSFGSYVGTGASGNSIVTGFEPAFVMVKRTDSTGVWVMLDNKRNLTNPINSSLYANTSAQEDTGSTSGFYPMNFYENGFEPIQNTGDYNASGASYIYMAFAADPTTVEPTLEDSFNTVLYTGNGGTQSVTGVGFQPDFLWIKSRNATYNNLLQDSVRGAGSSLYSNLTYSGDNSGDYYVSSFDSNGFTMNVLGGSSQNNTGTNYVAWNWKGAELPAINSNGSITSVVSANPAAGFSIVSHSGTGGVGTVGHGLNSAPNIIIRKDRDAATDWWVYSSETYPYFGYLNYTDAFGTESNAAYSFNQSNVTDSVFSVGNAYNGNVNNNSYIAYCFAEIAGFSKFGSYTGNNSTNGPVIDCGFEPAFVIIKSTDTITNWSIYDNKRDTSNPRNHILWTNLSDAELVAYPQTDIDFNATSFQLRGTNGGINGNGFQYIYMAFANQF